MMAMVEAMMAFQRQAGEELAACRTDLAAAGLGFSGADRAAIAAAASAHAAAAEPATSTTDLAAAEDAAARAMNAVYPPSGFPAGDPSIAPVDGVSLALYAIATRAIGWAPSSDPLVARVIAALGIDEHRWTQASATWAERIRTDIVLAAFYGQVFAQAADAEDAPAPTAAEHVAERAHLTCPSCGRSAQREGICTSCGAVIDQTAVAGGGIKATADGVVVGEGAALRIGVRDGETRECPHCGATVTAAKGTTCPYCKQSLVIETLRMKTLEVTGGSVTITGRLVIGTELLDDAFLDPVRKGDKVGIYKVEAQGSSMALADYEGCTLLHHHLFARRADLVELLVTNGVPIDAQTKKKGETALHVAVEAGLEDAVVMLLALGASTELTNRKKLTPLELARKLGNAPIVARLAGK